jgi:DNA-binding XRE family transcriptional regulator
MTSFEKHLKEQMKDPEFAKLWEESELEFQLRMAIIDARNSLDMTQGELAKAAGMKREIVTRLESGNGNPTLKTVQRIAKAAGKKVELRFV